MNRWFLRSLARDFRGSKISTFLSRTTVAPLGLCCVALLAGCTVGPHYQKPAVQAPPAFKELTPADFPKTDGWKVAQPADAALRGKWWEMFNEPQLNTIEEQVSVSNQNVAAAANAYLAARALVREVRSQYFPTVGVSPSITNERQPVGTTGSRSSFTQYELPFDATWQPDLFGRVRSQVGVNVAQAQASAADLQNVLLSVQAEVASDYFQLRGQDALKQLLDDTVKAEQQSLDLTQALFDTGIDSDEAVAQAETELESTQAEATQVGIQRAEFEHAIAVLIGQPPATFSLAVEPLKSDAVAVPFGMPSDLLERRPDIASSERLVAAANAQIGVSRSAYFPTLTLSGSIGLASTAAATWFTWPARFWSVGPTLAETIFDAGLRRATVAQNRAAYDEAVANYRQAVLNAFQQVEDNLSSLRILSQVLHQQDTAVRSAQRNLSIATDRYRLGIDPFLNVITAQTTLLSNQTTAVNLRIQQMTATVQLIEALGGGWNSGQLPTATQVTFDPDKKLPANTQPPANKP